MALLILFLILLSVAARADAEFRYLVEDWTTTKKLNIDHFHDLVLHHFPDTAPRLVFHTRYDIYGCRQDSFTYTVQSCALDIPPERYSKFLADVRAFPLETLEKKEAKQSPEHRSHGWILIDGRRHNINTFLTETRRAAFHALVIRFIDDVAPEAKRTFKRRTIEGDFIPPRPLALETLLKTPKKFDGKRVRLTGYYHYEFESSSLGPSENADYKESVWLGGDSWFATYSKGKRPNDTFITVEGTFNSEAGGHGGIWPGAIERVTRAVRAKQ